MKTLSGKVALVTGAASGIGRATAQRLAREGAKVIVCDVDEDGLATLGRELGASLLLARKTDVSRAEDVAALADAVHAKVPALDLLVNNAGVGLAGGFLDTTLDDFRWIVGINLWGVLHGCHFFLPKMVEAGAGRDGRHVVNVSSVLGFFAGVDISAYTTTKFAVLGLSKALRAELAPKGIGVSAICPGVINTAIVGRTPFRGAADESALRERMVRFYQRRNYGPEKVADAIVSAVRRDRGVVPVSPEAWALWAVDRISPRAATVLARATAKLTSG